MIIVMTDSLSMRNRLVTNFFMSGHIPLRSSCHPSSCCVESNTIDKNHIETGEVICQSSPLTAIVVFTEKGSSRSLKQKQPSRHITLLFSQLSPRGVCKRLNAFTFLLNSATDFRLPDVEPSCRENFNTM
jgi:hypothetical protein